jgi:hypothetical protein
VSRAIGPWSDRRPPQQARAPRSRRACPWSGLRRTRCNASPSSSGALRASLVSNRGVIAGRCAISSARHLGVGLAGGWPAWADRRADVPVGLRRADLGLPAAPKGRVTIFVPAGRPCNGAAIPIARPIDATARCDSPSTSLSSGRSPTAPLALSCSSSSRSVRVLRSASTRARARHRNDAR